MFVFCEPTLTVGIYLEKRSYSLLIWNANSRVWHMTNTWQVLLSDGSSCCSVASTNTAVLPIPDFAWQRISMPSTACGIHSCWTVKDKRKPKDRCVSTWVLTHTHTHNCTYLRTDVRNRSQRLHAIFRASAGSHGSRNCVWIRKYPWHLSLVPPGSQRQWSHSAPHPRSREDRHYQPFFFTFCVCTQQRVYKILAEKNDMYW